MQTVCSAQAHDIAAALPFVLAGHILSFKNNNNNKEINTTWGKQIRREADCKDYVIPAMCTMQCCKLRGKNECLRENKR